VGSGKLEVVHPNKEFLISNFCFPTYFHLPTYFWFLTSAFLLTSTFLFPLAILFLYVLLAPWHCTTYLCDPLWKAELFARTVCSANGPIAQLVRAPDSSKEHKDVLRCLSAETSRWAGG